MDLAIRKLERHARLTDVEIIAFRKTFAQIRSYQPRQDLLVEGERPAFVGVLLEGVLCRSKMVNDESRQVLSYPLPGDVFDLHTFLLARADHTISALTHCRVAVASHAAVKALSDAHPELATRLWRDALIEGAVFREWIVNCGRRSGEARLAHLLCEMLARMEAAGIAKDKTCPFPLTQADLGDSLGLSTVHVNRVLQSLRGQKLIKLQSSQLIILDWEGLSAVAGFDPAYLHLDVVTSPAASVPWPALPG